MDMARTNVMINIFDRFYDVTVFLRDGSQMRLIFVAGFNKSSAILVTNGKYFHILSVFSTNIFLLHDAYMLSRETFKEIFNNGHT